MTGTAFLLGLAGIAVAGWWGWRRWADERQLRHLDDCVQEWGGVPTLRGSSNATATASLERRPATPPHVSPQTWAAFCRMSDEIARLPETQVEEWLV